MNFKTKLGLGILAFFTLIAVITFALNGQIIWIFGVVMGIAQFLGGWFSAHYASSVPSASKIAYAVLVVAVLLSVFKLFNIF